MKKYSPHVLFKDLGVVLCNGETKRPKQNKLIDKLNYESIEPFINYLNIHLGVYLIKRNSIQWRNSKIYIRNI